MLEILSDEKLKIVSVGNFNINFVKDDKLPFCSMINSLINFVA